MTASETRIGSPTSSVAEAVIEPALAVMAAVPMPAPMANPVPPMVATAIDDELQLTALVRSCRLPSLYVPVAVNCWLVPLAIEPPAGLIAIETSAGLPTVIEVELEMELEVAETVAVPCPELVARP